MTQARRKVAQQSQEPQEPQEPSGPGANPLVQEVRGAVQEIRGGGEAAAGRGGDFRLQDELVVFVGFLGDPVTVPGRAGAWTLLYLDLGMNDWLIVEPGGCANIKQVEDRATPRSPRDLIWVRERAFVGRGSGPTSVESQFLTGDFMRAGEFEADMTGGTFDAPTGVFCQARGSGPRCCHRKSS